MPFCSSCGATVNGAFCNQCGTPVRPAAGAAPPPMPAQPMSPPPPAYPAAAPPVAVARKTSPIVWILIIIVGLFVLGGMAVVGTGMFFLHKVKQAGIDPDLIRRNPGLAVGKMIAATNPDVEVVNTDDGAGTITLKDKKTGKVVTMSFDQAKTGKFTFSATGDDGKTATMEFGANAGKLPSWIPSYPGAKVEGTFAVKGDSGDGSGEGGTFTLSTPDSASKVMSFYQDKFKEEGMKINLTTTAGEGGLIMATDDSNKRYLQIVIGAASGGGTSAAITYGNKK
jgi:hypothetical protein